MHRDAWALNATISHQMSNLNVLLQQLQQEQSRLSTQLEQINRALAALGGRTRRGSRNMSAAARERIAAAQRARWAKWKKARGKKTA
jgi:hypothetical protein